jgi:hypothetical protein
MIGYLKNRDITSINELIKNNFDVNVPLCRRGKPVLFHFIHMILSHAKIIGNKEFEIIKLIIENKADVNYVNGRFNALSLIYKFNRNFDETKNIIKLLLDSKANNYDPLLKKTALDYALDYKDWRSVKLLLTNGVIPIASTFDRYIHHINYDNGPIVKLLFEYTPFNVLNNFNKVQLPYLACNLGCLNIVRRLIDTCININQNSYIIKLFMNNVIIRDKSLFELVNLNIKEINSNYSLRGNILGDGKDLYNYIEISKLFIDHCAVTTKDKLEDIVQSYIDKRKNTIIDQLLLYIPKVLVNVILNYT